MLHYYFRGYLMYLRYIVKYRFPTSNMRHTPICANLAYLNESELANSSPYSKNIWYRYVGMPSRNLYYLSPSGERGMIPAETLSSREAGIEITIRAANTWYKRGMYPQESDPGDHKLHEFTAPSIEEIRLLLTKLNASVEYVNHVLEEYKQFIITSDNKNNRHEAIPKSKIQYSYFTITFQFFTDDFLRFNMSDNFILTCPVTGNMVSNYPFDHDFQHPNSLSLDTKLTGQLLGSIASSALPNLNEVLKDKFTHSHVNNETIFIVNNPSPTGLCAYPAQFYMPAMTFIDDNPITKYKRITTVVAPGLDNGVYTSIIALDSPGKGTINDDAKWTCISIEDALTRKLIFYTEKDVIEHVDLRIKDRQLQHGEVESKLRKLEVEDSVAKSKYQETVVKSTNNNLVLITGTVTAVCTLIAVVIKSGALSSLCPVAAGIGFIPKLICSVPKLLTGVVAVVSCAGKTISAVGGLVCAGISKLTSWLF